MGRILPRKNEIHLTRDQRAALADALDRERLPRSLVQAIEDSLDAYRKNRASEAMHTAMRTSITDMRSAVVQAQLLRARFPVVPPMLDVDGREAALATHLDACIAFWNTLITSGFWPPRKRGRSSITSAEVELGRSIVQALDHAHIPLTVGRKTRLVEVMFLVRQWAAGGPWRPLRSTEWNITAYRFTKMIVDLYTGTRPLVR